MSQWGSDVNANKLKKSYIKGFLDISGGNLIAQNSSTIMIMSAGADIPALQIKTDRFSVNTGTSTVDISYSTFASLGTLGVSYENSTTDLILRTKYLSTATNVNGNVTLIGNAFTPSNFSDLQVYGNIYAYNGTSSYGYSMSPLGYMFMAGDASINGSVRIGGDISLNGRLVGYGDISLNGNLRTSGNVNVGTVLNVANDSSLNGNVFIARDLSLNGNTRLGSRLTVVADTSLNGNVKLGSGINMVAINKDISSGFALDVSGIVNMRAPLYALADVSLGQKLYVNGDASLNGNIAVGIDVSVNRALYVKGRALFSGDVSLNGNTRTYSLAINKDISTGVALDVSGLSMFNGNVDIGTGSHLVAINKDVSAGYHLDISGNARSTNMDVNGTLYTRKIEPFNPALNGAIVIGSTLVGSSGSVKIGNTLSNTYVDIGNTTIYGGTLRFNEAGYILGNAASFALNIATNQTSGVLSIGTHDSRSALINIGTGTGSSGAINIATGSGTSVTTIGRNSAIRIANGTSTTVDISATGLLTLRGSSIRAVSDISINANTKLGSGANSVAINKDISSEFALDISGITNLRAPLYTLADVSLGQKLFVAGDVSMNGNLTAGRTTFNNDVSLNANARIGSGINSIAINKDISSGFALDVSGITNLRASLYTLADVSLGQKLYVAGDVSINGNLTAGRTSIVGDISLSGNVKLGSGSSLVAINKDISSGYAFDVSGITNLRAPLYALADVSMGKKLFVAGDVSLNGNIAVGLDVSVNRSLYVTGRALFSGDVSLNGNTRTYSLAINKDISTGVALDVSGLSMFNGNVEIGTGSHLVAINKDVSAGYHLDISGNTRSTNMDVNGTLYTRKIEPFNPALSGAIVIGSTLVGPDGSIKIGSIIGNTYVDIGNATFFGGTLKFNEAGYILGNTSDISLNIATTQTTGNLLIGTHNSRSALINIGTGTSSSGAINIATGSSGTSVTTIGRNSAIRIANGTSTTVDISATGLLTLRGSGIRAVSDISANANTKLGSGANSVAINKDISSGYALDVSGITNMRGALYVAGDVSMNNTLAVGLDVSVNRSLYVAGSSLLSGDISLNGKLSFNGVAGTIANSDNSQPMTFASGTTLGAVNIGTDQTGGIMNIGTADNRSTAINIGTGATNSGTVNILTGSGTTGKLVVGGDVSLNGNTIINQDLSVNRALFVAGRSLFSGDVSLNGNTRLNNSLAINKDISAGIALDVSGLSMFSGNVDIGTGSHLVAINKDVSDGYHLDISGNMRVSGTAIINNIDSLQSNIAITIGGTDRSGSINIGTAGSTSRNISIGGSTGVTYIKGSSVRIRDTGNGQLTVGRIESDTTADSTTALILCGPNTSGSARMMDGYGSTGTVTIGRNNAIRIANGTSTTVDISATGLLTLRGSGIRAVSDISINANTKLGSGANSVAINKDISSVYALDVSGNTNLRGALYVAGSALFSGDVSCNGKLSFNGVPGTIANSDNSQPMTFASGTTLGAVNIGTDQTGGIMNIGTADNRSTAINIGTGATNSGTVNILTGSGTTGKLVVGGDVSLNGNATMNQDLSVNRALFVAGRSLFSGDVSFNGNVDIGTGSNLVAINKDVSAGYHLDISGNTRSTNLDVNGTLLTQKIEPFNPALNGAIVIGSTLVGSSGSVKIGNTLGNTYVDIGNTTIFGGTLRFNETGYIIGNAASFALNIATNQTSGVLSIGTLNTRSAAINIGTGTSSSGAINIATGSGTSVTTIGRNSAIRIANGASTTVDISATGLLTLRGSGISAVSDISINANTKLGSGANSVAINKDISGVYALDVSGITNLRGPLYSLGDVSFSQKLFVAGDASINGNLLVQNAIAINKDISSQYVLDVNGVSQFRGDVNVGGSFTINGVPVNASSLTGNVQVGSNNGFVTVNKPQFYSDPSMALYYNFDTSYNNGNNVYNYGNLGSTFDGSFNGTQTGMIDTTTFKYGGASFKNNPTISNSGIKITHTATLPVSSTMSYSMWLYKPNRPASLTFDRIFEISDINPPGPDNNTIALDISSGGGVFPVLTSGSTSCVTQTTPIRSYDLCDGSWNLITWIITPSLSYIYVNGSIVQIDTISTSIPLTNRFGGYIGYCYNNIASRDFSGNIDDFRYYKDKALTEAEIFQLYNNRFYNLNISGGFIANGSSVIYEDVGSKASANTGTLTLLHGDASGSSSIMFKSVNDPLEYGYIQYEENATGSTGYHYGLMTIGIENDGGAGSYTSQADRVSLFPSGGQGFVGVNTKTPLVALDISGQARVYEGAGTLASTAGGSFTLEHTAVGGTSSIVFKGPNSITSDYAYVQYTDASTVLQSLLKYDFSNNNPATLTGGATIASTGTTTTAIQAKPNDNSLNWYSNSTSINGITPAYCISFNQTNLLFNNSTSRINYLDLSGTMPYSSSISVSTWIYPSGMTYDQSYGRYYILNLAQNTTTFNASLEMYIEHKQVVDGGGGRLYVLLNQDGTNYSFTTNKVAQNTWNHVAFTYDSYTQNGQLYINNTTAVSVAGTGYSGKVLNAYNVLSLGAAWQQYTGQNNARGFRGQMAFVNIFDRGLSAGDVAYLYNNPSYNVLTNPERGLMTIGIENDTGNINGDRIVLWPGAGTGTVGINTRTPFATLDVSGSINASGLIQGQRFNSTSDYRVKSDIRDLDASFTVDALRPVTYKFVSNGMSDIGFIAHEVQEQYPYLVQGEKDGQTTQSLNYNGIIGILTRELKELKATVMDLQLTVKDLQLIIQNQSDQSK